MTLHDALELLDAKGIEQRPEADFHDYSTASREELVNWMLICFEEVDNPRQRVDLFRTLISTIVVIAAIDMQEHSDEDVVISTIVGALTHTAAVTAMEQAGIKPRGNLQ
jgi:hypothetical protein